MENPPEAGLESRQSNWSVLIPFFNEEAYLEATLVSLLAQEGAGPVRFVLVDNGSSDGSREIVERFKKQAGAYEIHLLSELRPGKASALKTGLGAVSTPLVAVCDADTYYPPTYLQTAERLFANGGDDVLSVLAFGTASQRENESRGLRLKGMIAATLMPRQTHSGGYGQAFRTNSLKAVGGFDPEIWPYCLMDHEIMQRLIKHGKIKYDFSHWCTPSPRRSDRSAVRWTLFERLVYHVTPFRFKDWFFYTFLKGRFDARGVSELNLREKQWTDD